MPLLELKVTHFRNLHSVEITPSPTLNFLYGVNGSGKTSLLEAISVLAHGRSFRTRKYRRLVQEAAEQFTVFGRADTPDKANVAIGVSRKRSGESQFRIDGAGINSATELAVNLPLLVLNAESFGLLTGPPKQRRQFFDWLVFHVKPDFRQRWRSYSRCLKQRNSLLRRDKISYSDVRPWDLEIARLSEAIERDRISCIEPFLLEFKKLAADLALGPDQQVTVDYLNGWKPEQSYEEQLAQSFQRDRKVGYTSLGPHKSDFKMSIRGVPAGDILSRGQQKSMIAALYVAEARVFSGNNNNPCVFLLDDMPAELDPSNIARVGQWINALPAQAFVTSVEFKPIKDLWPALEARTPKVFHVEHGSVSEVLE